MDKKCGCLMLPTNKKATIVINPSTDKIYNKPNVDARYYSVVGFKVYDLYILSDDEIKEGDWCFDISSNKVFQVVKANLAHIKDWQPNYLKVIATTDSSLTIKGKYPYNPNVDYNMPSPSQSFISKYVEEYNKGNKIKEVMVEYEDVYRIDEWKGSVLDKTILKISSKDNTITIRKIKDSWTREEVVELLKDFNFKFATLTSVSLHEWIEKNL